MKKFFSNNYIKTFFIVLINILMVDIIFKLINGSKLIDVSMIRIFLSSAFISSIIALILSNFPKKIRIICTSIVNFIVSAYACAQAGFYNFLGVYMSLQTSSQFGAVVDYIKDFFLSFKIIYFLTFIPFILTILYFIFMDKEDYKYSSSPIGKFGSDQLKFVIDTLKKEITSRQACITIHDPIKDNYVWNGNEYVLKQTKDIPCTRTIQFMVVDGKLNCTVTMRSNDIWWGMSAVNVFNFTLMQEYIAGILGVKVGKYYHFVNNFHVYEDKLDQLKATVDNNYVEDYKSKYNFQYLLPDSLKDFDRLISDVAMFERDFREHPIKIDIDEYLEWNTPSEEFGFLWKDWALMFYKHAFPEEEIKFNNPYLNDLFSK